MVSQLGGFISGGRKKK